MNDRINGSNNPEAEIDGILSEFATREDGGEIRGDISSLADKYEVDVSDLRLSDGENPYLRKRGKKKPAGVAQGHRVVYEAEDTDGGKGVSGRGGEKKPYPVDEHGMRIVYDAGPDDPTADDAPFDDFSSDKEDVWKDFSPAPDKNKSKSTKKESRLFRIITDFIPWKGDRPSVIGRKIILTVSSCALIYSAFVFGGYFIEQYRQNHMPLPEEPVTDSEGNAEDPKLQYPDINFPEGILSQFVHMYAINQDFAGYLWVDGIDRQLETSVVGCNDNDKYLKTDFYGKSSRYGTPFLDAQNSIDTLDHNTTIHGHNMKDSLLFAILEDYMTADGFKNQPVITYATRYEVYKFKIYAVIITNEKASEDNGYVFYFNKPNFKNEESFNSYLRVLDQKKLYTTGVDINYDDNLLTLSTCYDNVYKTARLVVVARALREDETEDVDMSLVTVNENPRYPQAWYDAKGQSNPFKDAERWDNNNF